MDIAKIEAAVSKLSAAGLKTVWGDEAKKVIGNDFTFDEKGMIGNYLYRNEMKEAISKFDTTPAIRAYMFACIDDRGARVPTKRDMSFLCENLKSQRDQYGKPRKPWKPTKELGLKLKVKEAVSFKYSQESYADYTTTLIPIEGAEKIALMMPPESEQFQKDADANLASMVRYSDTHTGWAGSGCNFEARMESNEFGSFAVVTCRASIAD